MSKYYIAYGVDTETLEDPDNLVLVGCPPDWADKDTDELVADINTEWDSLEVQPLVGFSDVVEALRLIIRSVNGIHPSHVKHVEMEIINSLTDAVDNNS